MVTLWFYILFGGELLTNQSLHEKVSLSVKDGYIQISSASIRDSVKMDNYVQLLDNFEEIKMWNDGKRYFKMVSNKSGITIFTGELKGESIVMETRKEKLENDQPVMDLAKTLVVTKKKFVNSELQ